MHAIVYKYICIYYILYVIWIYIIYTVHTHKIQYIHINTHKKCTYTDIKHPFSNTWKKESISFLASCYNNVSQAHPKII